MAQTPQYAGTPKVGLGQVSVANTNRDGTGTIATVFTAGASGSRIDRVIIKALVTTTTGTIRLFLHDGASAKLLTELPVNAVTVSATQPAFETVLDLLGGISIPTGYSLRASTEKAETFNVVALGGDF